MYYFAYGTNLIKEQMKTRCPESKPMFKATLPNYKLIFADWSRLLHGGKATIINFRGEKTLGAIYDISDICMNRLDKDEAMCNRLNIKVYDEDGEQHDAVMHIKTGQPKEAPPSPEYLAQIQKGYKDWRLL